MTRRQMNFALVLLALLVALIMWLTDTALGNGCFTLAWSGGPLCGLDRVTCERDSTVLSQPDSYGVYLSLTYPDPAWIRIATITDTIYMECSDAVSRFYALSSFKGRTETPLHCLTLSSRAIWIDLAEEGDVTMTVERYEGLFTQKDSLAMAKIRLPWGPWNVQWRSLQPDTIEAWSDWDWTRDGMLDLSDLSFFAEAYGHGIYGLSDFSSFAGMYMRRVHYVYVVE